MSQFPEFVIVFYIKISTLIVFFIQNESFIIRRKKLHNNHFKVDIHSSLCHIVHTCSKWKHSYILLSKSRSRTAGTRVYFIPRLLIGNESAGSSRVSAHLAHRCLSIYTLILMSKDTVTHAPRFHWFHERCKFHWFHSHRGLSLWSVWTNLSSFWGVLWRLGPGRPGGPAARWPRKNSGSSSWSDTDLTALTDRDTDLARTPTTGRLIARLP